jgi:hypothetical protein
MAGFVSRGDSSSGAFRGSLAPDGLPPDGAKGPSLPSTGHLLPGGFPRLGPSAWWGALGPPLFSGVR